MDSIGHSSLEMCTVALLIKNPVVLTSMNYFLNVFYLAGKNKRNHLNKSLYNLIWKVNKFQFNSWGYAQHNSMFFLDMYNKFILNLPFSHLHFDTRLSLFLFPSWAKTVGHYINFGQKNPLRQSLGNFLYVLLFSDLKIRPF